MTVMIMDSTNPDIPLPSEAKETNPDKRNVCFICNSGEALHEHHINGDRNNNKNQNLVLLCERCHYEIHHGNDNKYQEWRDEIEYVNVAVPVPKPAYERWKDEHVRRYGVAEKISELITLTAVYSNKYFEFSKGDIEVEVNINEINGINTNFKNEAHKVEVLLENDAVRLIKVQ